MSPYLYIVPVFFLMIATEYCVARVRGRDLYRFQDTVFSVAGVGFLFACI
jgi:hypothetical protein